ncbi:T9SS type A sorting domain-containing protein [Hymenobacter negativus]|uniref:T9SS type A sorting domain-containing protein n=1 Tax=Hymenobacter negativus TaxID=2795026 RepID=A0ABS3QKD0_9BACT|nr:T9SS type A sorting domain-containing protein [Hymenobacter negativus]MBO2011704.1 T9SS type A sorting domain-containing protein [Hymenobacter negativus]
MKQASSVADRDLGCVVFICGSVASSANAVDSNPATAASISPPLAVGTAALRVGFDAPIPLGAQVNLTVSFTGSALSLGLVNNTTISTYTASGTQAKQTMNMSSVLNLTTLNTNTMNVGFTATDKFQEVELRTGSVLAVNVGYAVQLYHVTAAFTPLPVELTTFTGAAQASTVALKWTTASEKNSAYFQVERASAEAPERYQAIGQVSAAGSSTHALVYSFVDARPLAQAYYRLKQVDKDGTTAYSPIVAVRTTPVLALQAYPNPTNGRLTVTGPADARFTLFNQMGLAVQESKLDASEARQLDFSHQPDGLYFLRDHATGTTVKVTKAALQAQ